VIGAAYGRRRFLEEEESMRALRTGLVAAAVTVALVAGGTPAVADGGPVGGPGPGVCLPGGASGITGVSVGYPTSPYNQTLGLTLPDLRPDPIPTNVVVAPAAGESFAPITLTKVWAKPTSKVLRAQAVEPNHALMEWQFQVEQLCPDTGQQTTCVYTYHEMPDGSIFEVATLPGGQKFEHAFTIVCPGATAFRAVDAPQDLGVRLLAAVRANVPIGLIAANSAKAMREHLERTAGLPAGTLPEEVTAWAGALSAALGVAGLLAGPCGGLFTAVVSGEIGVLTQLLTIATATPVVQAAKAVIAVSGKLVSTLAFFTLVPTCLGQSYVSGGTLAYLYEMMAFLGSALWWSSTSLLLIYDTQYAISYWT
jgi:hypothetical protein